METGSREDEKKEEDKRGWRRESRMERSRRMAEEEGRMDGARETMEGTTKHGWLAFFLFGRIGITADCPLSLHALVLLPYSRYQHNAPIPASATIIKNIY